MVIKVSVFYPRGPEKYFDMEYYCTRHIPLVQKLCGAALKSVSVEQGIAGGTAGSPPSFAAMGHLVFESVESFQASFGPNMNEIVADVPNYTNIQPEIQVSEIKL